MRRRRLRSAAVLVGTALFCGAPDLAAQTTVLPSPADSSELREMHVAYALGPTRSTLWFGATIYGASDQVFIIVPAPPGAALDTTSDAWFEALRDATNPRILPPTTPSPACGTIKPPADGAFEIVGDSSHTPSLEPSSGASVRSFSELVVWAQGAGLDLSFNEISVLADLDVGGYRFVVVPFDPTPGATVLRTIRVSAPGSALRVPLLVSKAGASAVQAFVWVIGEGKAVSKGWPLLSLDPQLLSWKLGSGSGESNYAQRWDAELSKQDDKAWVLEAASHGLLLSTTAFASGKSSIPSVASTYFERAGSYGEGAADFQPCVLRAESLESSASRVGDACAPGKLAVLPLADAGGCEEQPEAGEIDPGDFRCGAGADDLALAFAGMGPSRIWLTRWSGRVAPWQSRPEEPFAIEQGVPRSPVSTCPNWDTTACPSGADAGGGTNPLADGGTPPSGGGGAVPGGGNPYDPGTEQPSDDYDDDSSGSVYVETSCWGDTTTSTPEDGSEGDTACGGDSSSSSGDAEGDSACGGDTSGSSSEDDGACAGDSSSDGDSACGGDSSSSSGGDDACSGDSSGGEDSACSGSSSSSSGGDSCSGGGSSSGSSSGCSGGGSSGGSDCSISSRSGKRRGKLPMSALTVLIVACVWPLRRIRRSTERSSS